MNSYKYKNIEIFYENSRFIEEVIKDNEYNFFDKDMVIVDVGCNIGTFSVYMYYNSRQIYALDISKECIDIFNKTIVANNLNIKTYNIGLSGKGGPRTVFANGDEFEGGWRLGDGVGTDEGYSIPTKSIKQFMEDEGITHIDLLKMDIEESEHEVFESEDFIEVAPRISAIIGEYHKKLPDESLKKAGFTFNPICPGKFISRRA